MSASFSPADLRSRFTPTVAETAPTATARAGAILLPLLLLLAWTAAVRLPFYWHTDMDEFFFSVIAAQWLDGGLPYVATFDIKPPGIFFLYAVAQGIFGASQATIKGMEIVAVALGAYALYAMVRTHGSSRAALWVAILFPVFTLALGGVIAVNLLLQLPFVIAAFAAAMCAIDKAGDAGQRLRGAFLAGLAIGAAGMVKQTAIFEAIAIFAVLCIYGERRRLPSLIGLYALGAALPAGAFAIYFLAAGHFDAMFRDVIVLALRRTDREVLAGFGPGAAAHFTFLGALNKTFMKTASLIFLWGGAIFAVLRFARLKQVFPPRLLVVSGIWLAAAFAGVLAGSYLITYYLLTIVTPLLILSAALFCHGLDIAPSRRTAAFAASIALAALSMLWLERRELFAPDTFLAGDFDAARRVSATILGLEPSPDSDRLIVLNRGLSVYTETGLRPPSPYFHPTHLFTDFRAPVADPLGETLAANPRFIVVANPLKSDPRWLAQLRARIERAVDYIAKHYRLVETINGERDSFTIYEFRD